MRDDRGVQIGEKFDIGIFQFDLDGFFVRCVNRFDFGIGGKKYDEEGNLILKEKDFNEK